MLFNAQYLRCETEFDDDDERNEKKKNKKNEQQHSHRTLSNKKQAC